MWPIEPPAGSANCTESTASGVERLHSRRGPPMVVLVEASPKLLDGESH
jgi:hypothetical protein